jgi:hypothetical protein
LESHCLSSTCVIVAIWDTISLTRFYAPVKLIFTVLERGAHTCPASWQ